MATQTQNPAYRRTFPDLVEIYRRVSLALFDLDGTLVTTAIDFAEMRRAVLQVAESAGVDTAQLGHDILGIVDSGAYQLEAHGLSAAGFRERCNTEIERVEEIGCANAVPLPGAVTWIAALRRRGVPVVVVTRNSRSTATRLLAKANIEVDAILARGDVSHVKPHPAHLHEAAATVGADTSRAMMVGDYWMDIQAARAADCALAVAILAEHEASYFDPCPPDLFAVDPQDAMTLLGENSV